MQMVTRSQVELAAEEGSERKGRVIDYFAVCGLGTERHCLEKSSRLHILRASGPDQIRESSHGPYSACLLDKHPPVDHVAFELPKMLPSVALPQGVRCFSRAESPDHPDSLPSVYTLILTDTQGAKIYVAVLKFRDRIDPYIARIHGLPPQSFADKCLCLVSRMPYLDDFSRILQQLHRLCFHSTGCPRPVWEMVEELTSMSLPDLRTALSSPSQGQLLPFSLLGPSFYPRPYHVSFLPLLENLSVDSILSVFTAALLEHKILLMSANPALLTASAEALTALLFPLKWTGIFVSPLPLEALECLEAPVPFIYGLPTENLDLHIEELDGVLVVDMDTSSVTWTSSRDHTSSSLRASSSTGLTSGEGHAGLLPQVLQLPRKVSRQLKKAVTYLIKPFTATSSAVAHSLSWEDRALRDLCLSQGLRGSRWGPSHDDVFQAAFIRAMSTMLRGYRDFLPHVRWGFEGSLAAEHRNTDSPGSEQGQAGTGEAATAEPMPKPQSAAVPGQGNVTGGALEFCHSPVRDAFDTKAFLKHKEETLELHREPAAAAFMAALTATHAWMAFLAEETDPHQRQQDGSGSATFFQEALQAVDLKEILSSYPQPRNPNSGSIFAPLLASWNPVYLRPTDALSDSSCGGQKSAGSEGDESGAGTCDCLPTGCTGGVAGAVATTQPPQRIVYARFPDSPASLAAAARAAATRRDRHEEEAAQKLQRQSAHAREERQAEEERVRLDMLARLCHHLSRLRADPSNADAAQEVLRVIELFELHGVSAQYFVPCIDDWFRDLASSPHHHQPHQGSCSTRASVSRSSDASSSFLLGPASRQSAGPLQSPVPETADRGSKVAPQPVAVGACVQLLAAALGVAHRQGDLASAATLVDIASQVRVPASAGQSEKQVSLVGQLRGMDIWHGVELWAALLDFQSKKGVAESASAALTSDQKQALSQKQPGLPDQQKQQQQQQQQQASAGKQKQAEAPQQQQQQHDLQQKLKQDPSPPNRLPLTSKIQEKGRQVPGMGQGRENQPPQAQKSTPQQEQGQKSLAQEQQAQERQTEERQAQEQQEQERLRLSPGLVQSLVHVMAQVGLEETEISIILDTLAAGLPLKMQILLRDQFTQMQARILVRPAATRARQSFLSFLQRPGAAEEGSGSGGGGVSGEPGVYSDKSGPVQGGATSTASVRWMQAAARVRSSVRQTLA